MKYNIRIDLIVDTDDYTDVKTRADVEKLALAIINGEADWPEIPITVQVTDN